MLLNFRSCHRTRQHRQPSCFHVRNKYYFICIMRTLHLLSIWQIILCKWITKLRILCSWNKDERSAIDNIKTVEAPVFSLVRHLLIKWLIVSCCLISGLQSSAALHFLATQASAIDVNACLLHLLKPQYLNESLSTKQKHINNHVLCNKSIYILWAYFQSPVALLPFHLRPLSCSDTWHGKTGRIWQYTLDRLPKLSLYITDYNDYWYC